MRVESSLAAESVAALARAHGMPAEEIDGNDVDARGSLQTLDERRVSQRGANETSRVGSTHGGEENLAEVGTKMLNGTGQ